MFLPKNGGPFIFYSKEIQPVEVFVIISIEKRCLRGLLFFKCLYINPNIKFGKFLEIPIHIKRV